MKKDEFRALFWMFLGWGTAAIALSQNAPIWFSIPVWIWTALTTILLARKY